MAEGCAGVNPTPGIDFAHASELALRARTAARLQSARDLGGALDALELIVAEPPARLSEISQQAEILILFVDTCRIVGRLEALAPWLCRLEQLLQPSSRLTSDTRARGIAALAAVLIQRGQCEAALLWCRRAVASGFGQCDAHTELRVLSQLTGACLRLGRIVQAKRVATQALLAAGRSKDPALQGSAWMTLANVCMAESSHHEANRLYLEAARLHRRGADRLNEARDHVNRGFLLVRMGLLGEGYDAFEDVRSLAQQCGIPRLVNLAILGEGLILIRAGRLPEGRELLLRAWRQARHLEMLREACLALAYLAEGYALMRRSTRARTALELCRRAADRLASQGDLVPEWQMRIALLALLEGEHATAVTAASQAAAVSDRLGLSWELARSLKLLGMAHALRGDVKEAQSVLRKSETLFSSMDEQLDIQIVRTWLRWLESRPSTPGLASASSIRTLPLHDSQLPNRAQISVRGGMTLTPRQVCGEEVFCDSPVPRRASVEQRRTSDHGARVVEGLSPVWEELGLLTRTVPLVKVLEEASCLAKGGVNVLILGETGTGKDLVARGIHCLSERTGPYVPVNCASVPEGLIEGELFGVERGAYTGADRRREGLIAKAAGGTLFLDEVGDMKPEAQGALLRFMDTGEVRAVGSPEVRTVSLGVLAATNRPLRRWVQEGRFREDLYYRLSQATIQLPPLRERLEDLDLLVCHLWRQVGGGTEIPAILLSGTGLRMLSRHVWPGNVRELKHFLRRIRILIEIGGTIGHGRVATLLMELSGDHTEVDPIIPPIVPVGTRRGLPKGPRDGGRSRWSGGQPSADEVRSAIEQTSGVKLRAAEILGMSRSTLYRIMKKGQRPN